MIGSDGILERSMVGSCTNYNPNKSKPTGVKAKDISGLMIYECFNKKETSKAEEKCFFCTKDFCANYNPKDSSKKL